MTWKRTPPGTNDWYVWSIGERDTRILRYGWCVIVAGLVIGAGAVALMDTAFAAFGLLIFVGLMIPCAAAIAVADHVANRPESGNAEARMAIAEHLAMTDEIYFWSWETVPDEFQRGFLAEADDILAKLADAGLSIQRNDNDSAT